MHGCDMFSDRVPGLALFSKRPDLIEKRLKLRLERPAAGAFSLLSSFGSIRHFVLT